MSDESIEKYQTICDSFQYTKLGALSLFCSLTDEEKKDFVKNLLFKNILINEEYIEYLFDKIKISFSKSDLQDIRTKEKKIL